MISKRLCLVVAAVVALQAAVCAADQDVLGCGGFIKASKSIDFSKINVQLLTKQGSLKYETDCAPNNGYYFIPVYETGDYILKVSPPLGWKFSPEEVSISIDGETDSCSLNKDIDFIFAGFGVVGQVLAAGSDVGPAGVDIELLSGDQKEVVQKTVTVKDGKYVFTAVAGADHKVRASHPTWRFTKDTASVVITDNNGRADDLVVAGFDVRGQVLSGSQPIEGVNIILFGSAADEVQCADNSPADVRSPGTGKQLCRTTSSQQGEFVFPVLPPGTYHLVPFYKGEHTSFEVSPAVQEIKVGLDSLVIDKPFVIEGFSVKGRVLTGTNGQPVANAEVTLKADKVLSTKTDKQGQYAFEKVSTGAYVISAAAPGIEFAEVKADISPSKPFLPDIYAQKFLVSGQLDFSTVTADSGRKLKFAAPGKHDVVIPIEGSGKFSKMLPSGAYSVSVVPSSSDTQMGIVFAPLSLDVLLKTEPVSGLYFSPVRVTIAGSVRCLGGGATCATGLTVVLRPDGAGEEAAQVVEGGRFSFQNQLPGRYSIAVDDTKLCWSQPTIQFNIESDSKEDLEFVQTGWVMEVHATHETGLRVKDAEGKVVGNLEVPVGSSSHCMSKNTEHTLQSTSCHQFQGENKGYKWKPGQRVSLIADKHLVSGRLTCVESIPDLQVNVQSPTEMKTIALTQPENKDGLFSYRFSYYSSPHEELSLEPVAAKFLFNPSKLHVSVADDCQIDSAVFTATKGLFVSGTIEPALAGARVELRSDSLAQPAVAMTDAKGGYSLGPFPRDLEYTVHAEKVGYVINQKEKKGYFIASKLASIVVNVNDANGGGGLAEVVVSISGGEQNFRTNQATGSNGTLTFLGLSPGEYFIKPMLKEYEFSPKSKLISVKEGTEEVVDITANRVANSLFGVLTSLNGEAEPGVTLEAVGVEEACRGHQEEGATTLDGKFRIRGLTPNCEYRLGLKKAKSNAHVERTIPAVTAVKAVAEDVTGLELIALRPRTTMDVSLLVKVKKDAIKNVKAKLFCAGAKADSPLHTVKLDTVKFVIFPSIQAEGAQCWITVEANSAHAGERVKAKRVEFTADKPFQHFNVELETESSLARGEMGQASWATLPLVILFVTAVLQWNTVSPFLRGLAEQVESKLMKSRSTGRRGNSPTHRAQEMSNADIDKAAKYVEASTRKKKVAKI